MKTDNITLDDVASSAMVVPPLARNPDLTLNRQENRKLIRHIEAGGISTLLYGGNANFYHIPLSEYAAALDFLAESVAKETWLIPSAGPDYDRLLDQAAILRDRAFPTVMLLPQQFVATPVGTVRAIRKFAEKFRRPVILYLKSPSYLPVAEIQKLVDDGLVCAIKYAIVRENPGQDPFLSSLVEHVDPGYVVSGIGERPAVAHLREFKLASFTTGSGAVAPRASSLLLQALQASDYQRANELRAAFLPLEDCRDHIHPIRVLHEAVTLSGIAHMGTILPHLHNLEEEYQSDVHAAASALLAYNNSLAVAA